MVTPFHTLDTHTLSATSVSPTQALVEVKVLEHIKREDVHDNHHVVHAIEHFYFRNHLCITFELLSINLYELIKNNKFQGLDLNLIRKISKQVCVFCMFAFCACACLVLFATLFLQSGT